jgi:SAM-dependent methyltransferase
MSFGKFEVFGVPMLSAIKTFLLAPIKKDTELETILNFLKNIGGSELRILDVGCGAGRVLRGLKARGYRATGVDINKELVEQRKAEGFDCLTLEAFGAGDEMFDVILMCHVIEHFPPHELLTFIDGYLDRLKSGGRLIISTPLLTPYFFDDFDHIRPYNPTGLNMVFNPDSWKQVQFYSKNKIKLENIWFRKSHFRILNARGRYFKSWSSILIKVFELVTGYLRVLSFGLIAKRDGWVGLYKKIS